MSELREKIVRYLMDFVIPSSIYANKHASQIHKEYMAWFREEVEKLKVLSKQKRDCVYDDGQFKTVGEERIAYCQAQLEDIERQLFEKLEGK